MKLTDPAVRHDIVFAFDITDGNPNGDPDASNRPRVDPETGHGLVTDVSIKRKIRDTLPLAAGDQSGYQIFVTAGGALNTKLEQSYVENGLALGDKTTDASKARQWLCASYVDIRLFGAVLSTGKTPALGQIRGPLQVSFARSVDPVSPAEHTITRVAHTTEADAAKGGGTMGNKWTVPYGLYVATLGYSASRGLQTGVTEHDLELLFKVLGTMFDHTASAARANMATRALHVFSHSDAFGSAPMHSLVDCVQFVKAQEVALPRAFSDYDVRLSLDELPDGVAHDQLV